ncbi:hypothetical protein [Halolamina sediminis]|uniref:hypothetical protein n=1 Tax=Halolamina sediminis TaxID=1480675 RepID=UPI0006B57F84|nr:hypothetical protein [Halolamina sediminis]
MASNTRLYGAAIGLVSGGYSLWSASTGAMGTGGWLMLVLGVVVLGHGALLLTDGADRLGDASGPLMIAYAVLMLLNQALLGSGMMDGLGSTGMDGGMQGGMAGPSAGMGWDAGMVALAVLMLLSGVIMTQDDSADGGM